MKGLEKVIFGLSLIPILLFVIWYVWFALGMIDTNSKKTIREDIVSECSEDLKSSIKDLKNVELYYYQGKIFVNIYFDNNLSSDESEVVIKDLREFIMKDNINKFFSERYAEMPILANVHSKDNSYYYRCPFYFMTDESSHSDVKSDYKIWYLTDSDGDIIEKNKYIYVEKNNLHQNS